MVKHSPCLCEALGLIPSISGSTAAIYCSVYVFLIPELLLALDQEGSWPESLSWAMEVLTDLPVDRQGHRQPPYMTVGKI
jgi:hypothetical protein